MGFFSGKNGTAATAQTGLTDPEVATGINGTNGNSPKANYYTSAPPVVDNDNNNRPSLISNGAGKTKSIFRDLDPSNTKSMPSLDPNEQRAYETIKRLQFIMDDCIKLPNCLCLKDKAIGIDPIIGLIPGFGDFGSAMISLAIVARVAPVLSRYTVLRMLVNVWIDAVIGTVPVVGDIFDMGWKANTRNVSIFEDHMKNGLDSRHNTDKKWVLMICFIFFLVCTFSIALVVGLVIALIIII